MNDIDRLLEAVHRMTGGLGVSIQTCTVNGRSDDYCVTVTWRVRYCGQECSCERSVEARSLDEALRKAVRVNSELEAELATVLAKRRGEHGR